MPIALRFSSEYPTGLPSVLAIIMARGRSRGRTREELVGIGRKPFSPNWRRGLRRGAASHHIFSLKAFTRTKSSFILSNRFESSSDFLKQATRRHGGRNFTKKLGRSYSQISMPALNNIVLGETVLGLSKFVYANAPYVIEVVYSVCFEDSEG